MNSCQWLGGCAGRVRPFNQKAGLPSPLDAVPEIRQTSRFPQRHELRHSRGAVPGVMVVRIREDRDAALHDLIAETFPACLAVAQPANVRRARRDGIKPVFAGQPASKTGLVAPARLRAPEAYPRTSRRASACSELRPPACAPWAGFSGRERARQKTRPGSRRHPCRHTRTYLTDARRWGRTKRSVSDAGFIPAGTGGQ